MRRAERWAHRAHPTGLADHIRQAHEDAQDVHISSKKISGHFQKIEKVELEEVPSLLEGPDEA